MQIIAFGNPETTTGGMALAFYSSVRMRVGRGKGGSLLDAKGEEQGIRAKVKVSRPVLAGTHCRVPPTAVRYASSCLGGA